MEYRRTRMGQRVVSGLPDPSFTPITSGSFTLLSGQVVHHPPSATTDSRSASPSSQLQGREDVERGHLGPRAVNGVDGSTTQPVIAADVMSNGNAGTSKSRAETFIESLPVLSDAAVRRDNKDCPICMEPYGDAQDSEKPLRLPCNHILGKDCLLIWLGTSYHNANSNTCPICRAVLIERVATPYEVLYNSTIRDFVQGRYGFQPQGRAADPVNNGVHERQTPPPAARRATTNQDRPFAHFSDLVPLESVNPTQRDNGLDRILEPLNPRGPPLREISNRDGRHEHPRQEGVRARLLGIENEIPTVGENRTLDGPNRPGDIRIAQTVRSEAVGTTAHLNRVNTELREMHRFYTSRISTENTPLSRPDDGRLDQTGTNRENRPRDPPAQENAALRRTTSRARLSGAGDVAGDQIRGTRRRNRPPVQSRRSTAPALPGMFSSGIQRAWERNAMRAATRATAEPGSQPVLRDEEARAVDIWNHNLLQEDGMGTVRSMARGLRYLNGPGRSLGGLPE